MRPARSLSILAKTRLVLFAVLLVSAVAGCTSRPAERPEILVFAAASLVDVLAEVEREFEARSDVSVAFSYGGSQTLARQIAGGAPADMLIAAGRFPVQYLAEEGLIDGEATGVLANKLVVAVRSDDIRLDSIEQLAGKGVGRVAIADPEVAPAGAYARESLTHLGLWDALSEKLVIGVDVRATLAYVETGNVDAALVYRTDANIARGVLTLDIVPPESHLPIVYPAAVIRRSERKASAREFLEFLRGGVAGSIFLRHGFQPLE